MSQRGLYPLVQSPLKLSKCPAVLARSATTHSLIQSLIIQNTAMGLGCSDVWAASGREINSGTGAQVVSETPVSAKGLPFVLATCMIFESKLGMADLPSCMHVLKKSKGLHWPWWRFEH